MQLQNSGNEHGVIAAGDLEVIDLRARLDAKLVEGKPDHALGAALKGDCARTYRDMPVDGIRGFGHRLEGAHQGLFCGSGDRRVIDRNRLKNTAAMITLAGYFDDFQLGVEKVDGWQEARPLQAVGIKVAGLVIGSHHQYDALVDQHFQQTPKDHCIRNVTDVKLVETQQPQLPCDFVRDRIERIFFATVRLQLGVNLAHEFMEMYSPFTFQGADVVEGVHHQRLATPHAAPHVQTARRFLAAAKIRHQPINRSLTILAILFQIVVQSFEMLEHRELGRIGFEIGLLRKFPVPLERTRSFYPFDVGNFARYVGEGIRACSHL